MQYLWSRRCLKGVRKYYVHYNNYGHIDVFVLFYAVIVVMKMFKGVRKYYTNYGHIDELVSLLIIYLKGTV